MSRRGSTMTANPVLIGAATFLVVIVAVFLSYNANNGLPFVPTYELRAVLPNASGLIRGNEVRMGGARIGIVSAIEPHVGDDGRAGALVTLKLDGDTPPLPRDSRLLVRPRSPLGLKYVELTAGSAGETWAHGATIPARPGDRRPVELDDLFSTWDEPTRKGSGEGLVEYGTAFAGRGEDLNAALRGLEPLAEHVERAARNLNDPGAGWDRLFPALAQAAREVAPVARAQSALFAAMDVTFAAMSSVREALQAAIEGGPRALDVATRELPAQARFVAESEDLFHRLRPGFAALAEASPRLARAFRHGEPAVRRAPRLNRRMIDVLGALERFAEDDRTRAGLQRLGRTVGLLRPTVAFAAPAQTTCNYLTLLLRNVGAAMSESDRVGSMLRFSVVGPPQWPESEAGPASAPADGPAGPDAASVTDSFLHSNPYPNTAAPGQERECEAGNERYRPGRQVIGNVPGNQGTTTAGQRRAEAGR